MGADIDLQMSRREAEQGMRDTAKVMRIADSTVLDEETGNYVPVVTEVYLGKSRLKHPRTLAKQVDAGSQLLVESNLELQVPVDTDDFESGDVVEITACPDRPKQVGRKFKIVGPFDGSQTTALRYRVVVFDGR